jgi:predicted AAA+ superfamily ATPase
LLENLAYQLLRKDNRKLHYFCERKECDIVVFEDESYKWLIQVTEKVHVNNQQRELNGLLEAMIFFWKDRRIYSNAGADRFDDFWRSNLPNHAGKRFFEGVSLKVRNLK